MIQLNIDQAGHLERPAPQFSWRGFLEGLCLAIAGGMLVLLLHLIAKP